MSATQIAQPKAGAEVDQFCINTIRTLSIGAVQQAKCGHPGTRMALARLVYPVWNRVMRFNTLVSGMRGDQRIKASREAAEKILNGEGADNGMSDSYRRSERQFRGRSEERRVG